MTKKQIFTTVVVIIATNLVSFWFGMYVIINNVGGKKVSYKESIQVEAPTIDTLKKQ